VARIVITCWGSYGDVNPALGLARGLKARGHDAVVAGPGYYRGVVEREGVGFHAIRPDVDPDDHETVRRIMDLARGTEVILNEIVFPSVRDMYHDLAKAIEGADLLVSHPVVFAGPVLAEERGIAWLSLVLAPMSFFSSHDLPVFPPAPWMKNLERVPGAGRALVSGVKRFTRGWTEPVRRLRADLGLPPGGDPIYEGQFSPFGTLALFPRPLATPQPDWPARTTVAGAVFFDRPGGAALPDDVARFLDDGPAPIVFTLGTSAVSAAGRFYHESAEAARRMGARAILLVGRDPRNQPSGALPKGVIAAEYAPHSEVFPRAAAVVHQGGAGTLAQAMRAGRPMLVVPWAHDQPDNAYRVTKLGGARTLYPKRYRAAIVEKHLRALLEDPSYAARAAEVGRDVRAEDGVATACEVIERTLAAR
jgi:rhamnosyltransferase subunit B